jgi:hypothetical protein
MRLPLPAAVLLLAVATTSLSACAPSLSPPFNQWSAASITVYRLQNYEPPPAQAGATFQIPPQIQQWVAGAAQLLPKGLIPPGLLGTPPAPTAAATDLRFHGFRVLQWQTISDPKTRSDVLDIFGHGSNFVPPTALCPYDEFGFAVQQTPGGPTSDILVSLSCEQVQAFGFPWPYASTGISPDTAKRIIAVAQKAFNQ